MSSTQMTIIESLSYYLTGKNVFKGIHLLYLYGISGLICKISSIFKYLHENSFFPPNHSLMACLDSRTCEMKSEECHFYVLLKSHMHMLLPITCTFSNLQGIIVFCEITFRVFSMFENFQHAYSICFLTQVPQQIYYHFSIQ